MAEAHYSKEGIGVVEGGMWLMLWPRDLGGRGAWIFDVKMWREICCDKTQTGRHVMSTTTSNGFVVGDVVRKISCFFYLDRKKGGGENFPKHLQSQLITRIACTKNEQQRAMLEQHEYQKIPAIRPVVVEKLIIL